MLSVPQAVCGTRSKVWFLVGGVGCEHMRVFAPGNRDEQSPEPLIIKWNEWAGGKAAELASTTDKPLDTLLAQLRGEKYVGGNLASLPSGIGQAFNK